MNWQKISRFREANASPGFLLWRVHLIWRRKIEAALAPHELTHVQFVLLAGLGYLTKTGESVITQNDLAKFTYCDINMTSQVLRHLEKRQLVARIKKTTDERAKYPALTAIGREKLTAAIKDVETVDHAFFALLQNQQTEFRNCLQLLLITQT